MKQLMLLIATFFKIGHLPLMPGTWASLATAILVYFIKPYWMAPLYIQIPVIVLIFLLGIPAASASEKHFDKKDPRHCVIDEVAGQMVALLLVPHTVYYYIAGFFLFRVFDVLKPPPVSTAEKLPAGLGIMTDDIVAGLYAFGILQLYIHIF
jgi:phosphatidylglycerophosphatase A